MAGLPDRLTGYIEVAGGPRCSNCKYITKEHDCPVVQKKVDARDGCCTWWDDGTGKPGVLQLPVRQSEVRRLTLLPSPKRGAR